MDEKSTLNIIETGLRGNAINNLLEGWSFTITEVSSNIYKIDGIDKNGHTVSNYGIDPIKVLDKCLKDAKRISQSTKLFLDTKAKISKMLRLKK